MSMFYRVAYWVGFTPWEGGLAQSPVAEQISARRMRGPSERFQLWNSHPNSASSCRLSQPPARKLHSPSSSNR